MSCVYLHSLYIILRFSNNWFTLIDNTVSWYYVFVMTGIVCQAVEQESVLFWYRRTHHFHLVKMLLLVSEQQVCAVFVISRQSLCLFCRSPIISSDTRFGICFMC